MRVSGKGGQSRTNPLFGRLGGVEDRNVPLRPQNLVHAGCMVLDRISGNERTLGPQRKRINLIRQANELIGLQIKLFDFAQVCNFGEIWLE